MVPTTETAAGTSIVGDRTSDHGGPGPDGMGATTLAGDSVRNMAGEDLGKVEEIMLDVRRGRIAYAVLSFGGFLGMGSKLFAIPWSALTLDATDECFILGVPKERLENAPVSTRITGRRWPMRAGRRISMSITARGPIGSS